MRARKVCGAEIAITDKYKLQIRILKVRVDGVYVIKKGSNKVSLTSIDFIELCVT
jgi:hypothetical protein